MDVSSHALPAAPLRADTPLPAAAPLDTAGEGEEESEGWVEDSKDAGEDEEEINIDIKEAIVHSDRPRYRDLAFCGLFWLALAVHCAVFIFCVTQVDKFEMGDSSSRLKPAHFLFTFFPLLFSIACTAIYVAFLLRYPGRMVEGTFILFNLLWELVAILLVSSGPRVYMYLAIPYFVLGPLINLLFYLFRKRIRLSCLLLATSIEVTKLYRGTFVLFVSLGIFCFLYAVMLVFTFAVVHTVLESAALEAFLVLCFLWMLQVANNILHVSVSGVFATYYFLFGASEPVHNPTLASFKRAMTFSLGSIALGSVFVAPVEAIRFIKKLVFRDGRTGRLGVLTCYSNVTERLYRHFNTYAFTEVAIFGKTYLRSANHAYHLIKRSGIEQLVDSEIIGFTFLIAVFGMGLAAGGFGLYLCQFEEAFDGADVAIITLASFTFGVLFMSLVTAIAKAGVSTIFICYCEDPETLKERKPELYHEFEAHRAAV